MDELAPTGRPAREFALNQLKSALGFVKQAHRVTEAYPLANRQVATASDCIQAAMQDLSLSRGLKD
jgi:hypothetical protein